MALVYIALMMVVLCAFLGLAIDIGYMYVADGQLQNAADSAALAGVVKLKSIGAGTAIPENEKEVEARNAAISFALRNNAAGSPVKIENDNSNTLSSTNDITVGHWNGASYAPGATPINAIQVRARRTADSPGKEVDLSLSGLVGENGWSSMGASAVAIAGLPVKASNYITFCYQVCPESGTTTTFDPPLALDTSNDNTNNNDYTKKFAWSTLSDKTTANSKLVNLICNEPASVEVCGSSNGIYSSMGTDQDSLKAMEWAFYNPGLDSDNKTFAADGKTVTSWSVQIPVTEICPPGAQGNQFDPKKIVKYATIKIIAVCPVSEGSTEPCNLDKKDGNYIHHEAPDKFCKNNGYPDKTIVISSISCSACGGDAAGLKPSLLR